MKTFHISVKKNNKIFRNLEKVEIDLNTASNIVKQAEDFVTSLLASMNTIYSEDNYSWKVYRYDRSQYMSVTISKNWVVE